MSSRVTRDHHSLARNLKLNGKYISNDGGSDGISIDNYGTVLVGGQDTSGRVALNVVADENPYLSIYGEGDNYSALKIYEAGGVTQDDYFDINVQHHGATTISTVDAAANAANLTFQIDGDTIIDNNVSNTSAGTYTGLYVDMDKTGASTSDNTVYGLKCMVDSMQSTDGTNTMYGIYTANRFRHASDAGTITGYGAYIEAAGSSNGTSKMIGAHIGANTGDTNIGIQIECTDGGEDIKIKSTADGNDYFTIATTANGATTLTTVDNGGAAANLTLDPDGDIILESASLTTVKVQDGENDALRVVLGSTITHGTYSESGAENNFHIYEPDSNNDFCMIRVQEHGVTTISTTDANAAVAHLVLDPDGELN